MGAYWFHGIMSWVKAIWLFALMGSFVDGLRFLGTVIEALAFGVAGLNFIAYMPAAILWMISAINRSDAWIHKLYLVNIRATNIASWIIWIVDIGIWLVLLFFILLDELVTA